MTFLWLLLATIFSVPAEANSAQVSGPAALQLWRALPGGQKDMKQLTLPSATFECDRAEARCFVSGSAETSYLYRSEEARVLYRALNLPEFEGKWGHSKVFADSSSGLLLRCVRFPSLTGEAFSCEIYLP